MPAMVVCRKYPIEGAVSVVHYTYHWVAVSAAGYVACDDGGPDAGDYLE